MTPTLRQPRRTLRWAALLLMIVAAPCLAAATDDGPTADQRFLAGLRQRGLFALAESYCADRLKDPALPPPRRAELTVEWSRCLAEQAVDLPRGRREPLWNRAAAVVDEFAEQYPDNPRLVLVRFQGALSRLAWGELARQEAELLAGNGPLIEESLRELRAAAAQLRRLIDDVDVELRRRGTVGPSAIELATPGRLTNDQLISLQRNIEFQLARALRNLGQCHPADSTSRTDSLNRAVQLLDSLTRLTVADGLVWQSRIDRIVCYRLLGDRDTAWKKLSALDQENLPAGIALRARAEWIHLALEDGRADKALEAVAAGRQREATVSPELDYAHLETYLFQWQTTSRAKQTTEAERWKEVARKTVELIEKTHGPYWTRRAEMKLASVVRGSGGADLAMLIRVADDAYLSQRFDDALADYDLARAEAQRQGDLQQVFDLASRAAEIQRQRNLHPEALRRYRELACAMSDHAGAHQAHLRAIDHAGQLIRAGQPDALEQYVALLEEHLKNWPDRPTANWARFRRGALHELAGQWEAAIGRYRAVAVDAAEYPRAVEAAGRCQEKWFAQRKAADPNDPTLALDADEAAAWLKSVVVGPENRWPERWSPLARSAAMTAARIWLNYTSDGHAAAGEILDQAVTGAPEASEQWPTETRDRWISDSRALLVFSLVCQGNHDGAMRQLNRISAGTPEGLMTMLEGLHRAGDRVEPNLRGSLARLQLQAIELLGDDSKLSADHLRRLAPIRARALANAGRGAEALRRYEALAKQFPRDGPIQEAYAQLLLERDDTASLNDALTKWRQLAQGSLPGSPRWFRAKYSAAKAHHRLGNDAQAVKLIQLVKILHPELGGAEMKGIFEALLRECGG
ncbi:MAG: hypothetical protein HQ581_24390 [Planctomycetes bacterium]|nr:hypothetical protein [Planctomycetota bacterium]